MADAATGWDDVRELMEGLPAYFDGTGVRLDSAFVLVTGNR
jgi:hypothetical protein